MIFFGYVATMKNQKMAFKGKIISQRSAPCCYKTSKAVTALTVVGNATGKLEDKTSHAKMIQHLQNQMHA